MSSPSKGPYSGRGSPGSSRLFKGQRIKRGRAGGRGSFIGRGSLEVRNRQNWLNIDQASALNYFNYRTSRGSESGGRGSRLTTGNYSGPRSRGGGGVSRVARSISVQKHEQSPQEQRVVQAQPILSSRHSSSSSRNLMIKPSAASALSALSNIRQSEPFTPSSASVAAKRWFPIPNEKVFITTACEPLMQRDSIETKKMTEFTFGCFIATTSLLNPIIPVLPRLVPHVKLGGTDGTHPSTVNMNPEDNGSMDDIDIWDTINPNDNNNAQEQFSTDTDRDKNELAFYRSRASW